MRLIRSFIAIDVNDPGVVNKIVQVQKEFVGLGAVVKFVEPENLHITIKFLGEIPESLVNKIIEVLFQINFEEFTIFLRGVGCFPNINRPKVLWIGVSQGAENLTEIHRMVDQALRKIGIRRDAGKFHPHVTIGRVKGGRTDKLGKRILNLKNIDIGIIHVNNIKLKKSTLTSKGPIYTTLHEKRAGFR